MSEPSPSPHKAPHKDTPKHLKITEPSPWVARWADHVRAGGRVLDVAAGGGRHGRLFLARGHDVTFIDRTVAPLADLCDHAHARVIEADLETGLEAPDAWPLAGETFDAVIVVNYLHRALFDALLAALAPGGVLLYETFARGNEDYARPRNPDHLLKSGELLALVAGRLQVVAYEHGRLTAGDIPGVKQRLFAINDATTSTRDDGEPPAHDLV